MTDYQAVYDGPGLTAPLDAALDLFHDAPAGGGGASAVYDGPGLTAPLDAALDLILPEPEAG